MELDLTDRPFVVFDNARRDVTSIVWRQPNGDYGMVDIAQRTGPSSTQKGAPFPERLFYESQENNDYFFLASSRSLASAITSSAIFLGHAL